MADNSETAGQMVGQYSSTLSCVFFTVYVIYYMNYIMQGYKLSPSFEHIVRDRPLINVRSLCFLYARVLLSNPIVAILLSCMNHYWKKSEATEYWSDQNVPQVTGSYFSTFLGLLPGREIPRLDETEKANYDQQGRIYGRYDGLKPVLTVADPGLLETILNTDFHSFPNRRDIRCGLPELDKNLFSLDNADWKRVRSIATHSFTPCKLKKMIPLMEECINNMIQNIRNLSQTDEPIVCQKIYGTYVLANIEACAFGMKRTNEDHEKFVAHAKQLLLNKPNFRTTLATNFPILMRWFNIRLFDPETVVFYKNSVLDTLKKRRNGEGPQKQDFIGVLLDYQKKCKQGTSNQESETASTSNGGNNTMQGLSDDEIVAQCVTFFVAGYDATNTLFSNAMYHLAMHQDYQDRMIEEIKIVMEESNGQLDYNTVGKLKFMQAFLDECMRLVPSLVRNERRVEKDCVLRGTDIQLKKDQLISIPVYCIHRDPEWYPEPDVFNPERFYEKDMQQYAFVHLPFGTGPRKCIASRFVLLQVKLCLSKILLQFRVLPTTTTPTSLRLVEIRNTLRLEDFEISFADRTEETWEIVDNVGCSTTST